jgi:chromate transporter
MATGSTTMGLGRLFWVWLQVGLQSFGGGASTLYLIRRACMAHGWLTEAEFARAWGLVQVSPGINLIKLTVLLGYQVRGAPGVLVALAGLLAPSAFLTVLMTAGFSAIRDQPAMQAALRGLIPATIGLSLATGLEMARGLLGRARDEGRFSMVAHVGLMAGSAALLLTTNLSPVLVLLISGGVGAWALARVTPPLAAPADEPGR